MHSPSPETAVSSKSSRQQNQEDDHIFKKQPVPKWLPVTLLALTTACLTVPGVVLWRQRPRSNFRSAGANISSAPPRRGVASKWKSHSPIPGVAESSGIASTPASSYPPPRRAVAVFSASTRTAFVKPSKPKGTPSSSTLTSQNPAISGSEASQSVFDGPVAALGAFGIATLTVGVGATLGVWGVQRSMGVQNTEEFAARMRELLLKHIPVLSRKLYGSHTSSTNDNDNTSTPNPSSDSWSWAEAEDRLRDAFDKGGFPAWAEAAMQELEAEGQAERRRREL